MSVAAAISGFIHVSTVWIQRGRVAGRQGSIQFSELYRQPVNAMVTEPDFRKLMLSSDATVGQDNLEIYYSGRMVSSSATLPDREPKMNDVFMINGSPYVVRQARWRPEGGFTHVSVMSVQREQLSAT